MEEGYDKVETVIETAGCLIPFWVVDVIPVQCPPRVNARIRVFFLQQLQITITPPWRIGFRPLADLESQAILNYAATAKRWDIEWTTLARRHQRKTTSRGDANSKYRQRLTNVQEEVLLGYIDSLTGRNIPPTSQIVQNLAEELVGGPVGKNWTSQFIKRHSKRITSIYLRPIDKSRVSAESAYIFEQFYALVLYFCWRWSNFF